MNREDVVIFDRIEGLTVCKTDLFVHYTVSAATRCRDSM